MATFYCPTPSGIIMKGYLGTGMERKTSLLSTKSKSKHWYVLKQEQGTVLDCYKDKSMTKLKERIRLTPAEVEIDRHAHDNYLSIKRGKQVQFLRAENRQQLDDWYAALTRSLGGRGGAENTENPLRRDRAGTDTASNRPPVRRRRNKEDPQTTEGVFPAFKKVLNNISERPLPPIPPEPKDDDDDTSKIRPPYCCVRNHVMYSCENGTNMADEDVVYQNIHFVASLEEWIDEVETRRRNLGYSSDVYNDLNAVLYMQNGNESNYATRVFRRREPEEHDERDCQHAGVNDLNHDNSQRQTAYKPNLTEEDAPRRSISEGSNEDNTTAQSEQRPTPPPIPTPTGEFLDRKIEKTKEEQKQPHGISKSFPKSCLVGDKIKFMEMKDGIWVMGWDQREKQLRGALKVGDQVIKVNKQALTSASFTKHTISSTDDNEVTLVVKRIPHGTVCIIKRDSPRDDLGFRLERNEIIGVDPRGRAASLGDLKPQTTGVDGCMCNWAITEINTVPVDLFASADDVMKLLDQAGREVALIVQPVDFIQMMRDNLTSGSVS